MIPTGRLWTLLSLLAVPMMAAGFFPGLGGVVLLLDVLVLGLAGVDLALARQARLEVSRKLPARLSVGAPNRVELLLVHRSGRAVDVRVRDDVPDAFSATPEEAPLHLPPNSQTRWVYRVTPEKRGRFGFGDVHVRVRGPLGLVFHERAFPAAAGR